MIQAMLREKPQSYDERYLSKIGTAHSPLPNVPKIACDDIMAGAIALLSDQDVESMTREDMVDTVWSARDVPHSPVKAETIEGLDDLRLRRVLYHVRRWARNRINEQSKEKGWTPYFRDRF